ncbi:16S rRNA (uracil(1498)-N(3))-methyltransferase [Mycoplasma sp. 1331]|uniref:Ribosomal RNA small subunit methyltransferase E n=2 Tax=Mycoplasma tauri TaxID=547987 RepID=A0A953NCY2_9MOLU|nr:16S rRNA (uracil(1498)-N(3))-methyltransferase [Mycoplasma tauri]MBZ4195567.1 16S rRNA (uracil(1498)-N(3))-methyltransferase [Mycoplasma tauri]QSB07260.1 16S rRNA (uracil(1498)-N(3))-methyltransferase [Mycoplasma tauri]
MHRFFVSKKENNYFILDEKVLKHIKSARVKNQTFLCNYNGEFYSCIFENSKAKIIKKEEINHEFEHSVILAAPIIKIKRFEWILQKATELGVTQIIPMNSKYVDQSIIKNEFKRKNDRFQEIIKNAAEQSFRNKIPDFFRIMKFEDIIANNKDKVIYVAYENQNLENIETSLQTNSVLIVGPEGGFTVEEIEYAKANGCKIVSLGKTILRAETACLYMLSNIREN